jgi:hypothetical protein
MHINILNNVKSFVDYTLSNVVMEKVERRRKMTFVVMIKIDREECLSVARDIRMPCLHHLVVRVYTRYSSSVYSAYLFCLRFDDVEFVVQRYYAMCTRTSTKRKFQINYT